MSLARLEEHRRIWNGKPLLRRVYGVWFDALLAEVPARGRALELGAGPGLLSQHVRKARPELRWLAADILPAPWNDLAADGMRLPFGDASFDAVVALDLVHHVEAPERFFAEVARVLGDDGRLVAVEPWVTPLSFPVYRWLHPEGCRPGLDPWQPFGQAGHGGKDPFTGDAAVVWRLVRDTHAARWKALGFSAPRVRLLNGFAYLASLGFRRAALAPAAAAAPLLALDRLTAPLARTLALRVLAVWEKDTTGVRP